MENAWIEQALKSLDLAIAALERLAAHWRAAGDTPKLDEVVVQLNLCAAQRALLIEGLKDAEGQS